MKISKEDFVHWSEHLSNAAGHCRGCLATEQENMILKYNLSAKEELFECLDGMLNYHNASMEMLHCMLTDYSYEEPIQSICYGHGDFCWGGIGYAKDFLTDDIPSTLKRAILDCKCHEDFYDLIAKYDELLSWVNSAEGR